MAALELALAQSHALHSQAPHPLLSSTYEYQPSRAPTASSLVGSLADDPTPALGMLTINGDGGSRFVGSTAGSELLESIYDNDESATADVQGLRALLPDWETEGRQLCETYWENVGWMCVTPLR